jgi:sarcosine oxidase gamma subunit
MERTHLAAGASMEERDGWRIAVYESNGDLAAWAADVSHVGKLDVRGEAAEVDELTGGAETGQANHTDGVWTLRLSPTHAVVICPARRAAALRERIGAGATDMTCGWAGVMLGGERVRDVFHRSSGLDVRESRFGAGRCIAGSVMRCNSIVLNDPVNRSSVDRSGEPAAIQADGETRFWVLCGWEFGEYMWESLLDAGVPVGIGPVSASVALREEVAA